VESGAGRTCWRLNKRSSNWTGAVGWEGADGS
jgi:hypothetical protein